MLRTNTDFLFTPASNLSFNSFNIVSDDVLEFDELFFAELDLDEIRSNGWNARAGEFPTTFILIRDDDCELCSVVQTTIPYALKLFAHQTFCVCSKEGHPQIVTLKCKHNADVPKKYIYRIYKKYMEILEILSLHSSVENYSYLLINECDYSKTTLVNTLLQ